MKLLGDMSVRPHERMAELAAEYGDVVSLPFVTERIVLLNNPHYIEHVLHFRHQHYDKRTPRWRTLRQIWGNGLLTADGDHWRRQRQRMQPAFHEEAMRRFVSLVTEEAGRMSAKWARSAAAGEPRDVYEDMLECAMRALTRAMFGADIEGRTESIIHAVDEINAYINPMALSNLLNLPLAVRRFINPAFRRFQRALHLVDDVFDQIIRARLASGADRSDLLGMIMYAKDEETSQTMSLDELRDEMMIILMAGHETTGIAMAWTWYWLATNPKAEQLLHAEVDAVLGDGVPGYGELAKLEYTKMVFQEAMRLTPPIWGYERRAREEDWIDGYRVPRGSFIAMSPYVLQRHPAYWERPDEFEPLRFTPERIASRPTYTYFPFGGGPRRCIGMRFAFLEAQLILATLARGYVARLVPGHPVEAQARLNLPPKFGLRMTVEARRESPVATGAV